MARSPAPVPPVTHAFRVEDLLQLSHAAFAIMLATRIERRLELLLQSKMPRLPNRPRDKLFDRIGFPAKIDLAYSMDLISDTVRDDLHAIRIIRNEFAHSDEVISFNHKSVTELMPKLSAPNGPNEPPQMRFLSVYKICRQEIIKKADAK